jgi:hypothetical protein
MSFPSFWFVGALYVAWVSFKWVYFLLDFFFFYCGLVDITAITGTSNTVTATAATAVIATAAANVVVLEVSLFFSLMGFRFYFGRKRHVLVTRPLELRPKPVLVHLFKRFFLMEGHEWWRI